MQNWFLKPKSNSKTAGLVQAISRRNQELSKCVCSMSSIKNLDYKINLNFLLNLQAHWIIFSMALVLPCQQ